MTWEEGAFRPDRITHILASAAIGHTHRPVDQRHKNNERPKQGRATGRKASQRKPDREALRLRMALVRHSAVRQRESARAIQAGILSDIGAGKMPGRIMIPNTGRISASNAHFNG